MTRRDQIHQLAKQALDPQRRDMLRAVRDLKETIHHDPHLPPIRIHALDDILQRIETTLCGSSDVGEWRQTIQAYNHLAEDLNHRLPVELPRLSVPHPYC